ncbi:MAG: PGF-CTERM sorting domain-containing protein [Candidatus Poseidoniia archaeon]|nr:PGF-CTERM sorting domain-containing protein [Candidatus Poseidoniia archaeon]MDP7444433.1 PGF-CTERM sorting domain-containing protein [Candidatus Poseidoniia archaeon]
MERNVRNLGVFVATLAMIASVLIVPSVSADGHDLEISGLGDDGVTSYASQYGTAEFLITISSMAGSAHNNVSITASADWGSITTGASVTDGSNGCTDENVETDFGAGGTIEACISVSVAEAGADIGDVGAVTVSATSAEDSIGDSTEFTVQVSNWRAYSNDGAQSYAEGDTNQYTISVKNIKVDENGDAVEIDDAISISLSTVGSGWNIDSDDAAWDKAELTATIQYLAADADYDLVLDIQLVGEIVPASSYVGNSFVVFTVQDGTVYTLVSLEASVADNFSVNVTGSGNYDSDSGCSDAEDATGWTPTVKNFGNTMDSFSITFDTADAAGAGWTVDGATSDNTGMLNPKFEHNEADGTGMFTMNVGLHIPAGLPAGTMHGFTMTVISDTDSSVTQTQSFSATVTQCYGLTMTVDKAADSANPGNSADFTISVTNGGNGDDTVSLATMGASEWSPTLAESELTIASGATSTTLLSITVPSDASANAASGSVMAHAYSEGCGDDTTDCGYAYDVSVSVTANQVYGLTAGYYSNETDVVKDTVSVQETMTVQMKFTVTNDGNGNDEIVLSLANAPAWVTLGQTEALAGPGQTMTLTVDVGPAGAVGDYTFQVTATSADGTTSSTTEDLTVTVTEKVDDSGGPATEKVEEDDSPGFGIITAIAAIGAVLLIRRRL